MQPAFPAWIALSDAPDRSGPGTDAGWIERGSLVLEFAVPLDGPAVLLDHRMGQGAEEWVLSILADPAGGIAIRHRLGRAMVRHSLPGPLPPAVAGVARLVWSWGMAQGRRWSLQLDDPARADPVTRRGDDALPVPGAGLRAICGGAAFRHPAVLWFGVTAGEAAPATGAWVGVQTPVDTSGGPVAAGNLRAGDAVLAGGALVRVAKAERICVPARGSHCPVLLRAPYFGGRCDLLVSPDQPVAMTGAVVEYLFGDETVLVEARHLVDGRAALFHDLRAVAEVVRLTLDRGAVLRADGCGLAAAGPAATPHRLLRAYEVPPLLGQLGRGAQVRAA